MSYGGEGHRDGCRMEEGCLGGHRGESYKAEYLGGLESVHGGYEECKEMVLGEGAREGSLPST